ncbi:zinc finger protein 106-like [Xyrauchen texanus]|uniref:zinc finger protein 106-like n=1 Tax=Xyrauchen texanus TaxID=154827 RepID=UPI002241AD34|nr:zinc finger protein 106-like [Xyrauchen texanus]XP_052009331.1 zinc finger protein 106-like [Xyrauchen texanus]XP_052009332.1 zinc finger protein 106-like [Xyrauchen texanus]
MGKEQKCILCETVYSSKKEMEEHMRSMLHHRELENLKGRDCGHECRVCGVTVVSLTDYASHISSLLHKQRIEDPKHQPLNEDKDEEYFDKDFVQLIEKRKEIIKKEEAAAKQAKEERENIRRFQEHQAQRQGPRPLMCQQYGSWDQPYRNFPQLPKRGKGSKWQNSRFSSPDHSNWSNPNQQIRYATWHAGGPPDLHRWGSMDRQGGSMRNQGSFWGGRQGGYGVCPPKQRNQFSWKNSQYNFRPGQYMSPGHFKPPGREQPRTPNSIECQTEGQQCVEESGGEHDYNKCNDQMSENAHRWAPSKLGDSSSQTMPQPTSDKSAVESQENCKAQSFNKSSQDMENKFQADQRNWQHKLAEPYHENNDCRQNQKQSFKNCGSSSMDSFTFSLTSKIKRSEKPGKHPANGASWTSCSKPNSRQVATHDSVSSKGFLHSPSSSEFPQHAIFNEEQEHLLSEMLRKAKETLLNRKGSVHNSSPEDYPKETKTGPQTKEPQQVDNLELNKNKKLHQHKKKLNKHKVQEGQAFDEDISNDKQQLTSAKTSLQIGSWQNNTRLSLQSLQVSTSTMDHEDEEFGEREENLPIPVQEQAMFTLDEDMCPLGEGSHSSLSQPTAGCSVPPLSKLALPACLKRDLNRHMGTKGKAAAHEPNLNIARRIRNVSGSRKIESEKDCGLKPTLRQLISSSCSRRIVNWDQVYQEVNRKKQEQGKGLPRFGIEMVPCEPEGTNQINENDDPLCEGFHWDTLLDFSQVPVPSRKRSLSESSVVKGHSAGTSSLLKTVDRMTDSSPSSPSQQLRREDLQPKGDLEIQGSKWPPQGQVDVEGISGCTSDTELNDTQGVGKKRRAPGDVLSPEIPTEDRKSKRQKIKAKKERSQVDQLLAVSLREEELNSSLQAVDSSLIQARAALQSAYLEVQRVLMVKQQVTTEMNSLRTRRIEILQGMQGEFESPERERSNEEVVTPLPQVSKFTSHPLQPTTAAHSNSSSPTSPLVVTIKQEPTSPNNLTSEHDLVKCSIPGPHSTTFVQTGFTACQTDTTFKCGIRIDSSQDSTAMSLSAAQSDHVLQPSCLKESRQSSQEGLVNPTSPHMSVTLSPKPLSLSNNPEINSVKRVRKLKKRKYLKKVKGNEQPEISDSELDGEQPVSRPSRKYRSHQRSSGTNTSPSMPEEKEEKEDLLITEASKNGTQQTKLAPSPTNEAPNSDSSELEMVELPPHLPTDFVNLDSSEPDELMPEEKFKKSATAAKDHTITDPQNLACNEVTSTSEINTRSSVKACESEIKSTAVMESKVPSDVSDPGEEVLPTEGEFEGHKEAVNGIQIHNGLLYTCSGDRTIRAFSLTSRKCVAVFEGHSSKINCLLVSSGADLQQCLYSGSSDQTIRCYSLKTTECLEQLSLPDRVLCLHNRWKILYAGLANGSVITFSLRNNKLLDVFECHGPRAVSCLATAQEGARRVLLVGSYDTTISVRDAKNGLLLRTLEGHTKTVLCMKVVNDLVFSGSSDQSVHAHNIHTGELVRIYKGHSHAVTVVAILGKVMVTACLDKLVRVYELQSHDRLQVYGGHSDMVMCMVIHKSMIYTGCYNGSVRAVRLNLIQNYRCLWYGCTLIFGVMEHLQQHLLDDHTNQQTFKCRWRNCDSFFTTRNGSEQVVHSHMQKHVKEDSNIEP